MAGNGAWGRLRLIAVAAAAVVLSGCADAQTTITSADGLSERLQTFAIDTAGHLLAAWLF